MIRGRVIAVLLLVPSATALWSQESSLSAGGGPSWKGIDVRFVTKAEPPGDNARSQLPGAVLSDGSGVAHHIINDPAHKRSFGYDLRLNPDADGNSAEVRIEPLHAPQYSVEAGWTLLGLPKYPVIPDVKVGDAVALDLLVNPATGQKIVDYLLLERADRPAANRAHDFSLDDVFLYLDRPRVLVNGKLLESTANFRQGTAARVVWLYLRGHGRFVLSLFPMKNSGFKKMA